MAKSFLAIPALVLGLIATSAYAQSGPTFKFSGFGSLAGTKSSEKNADFTSTAVQFNGPGFSKSVDFGVDSRVGLQADVKFSEVFSAAFQVISDHRYDDSYTPYLNMAHLKVQATPSLSFRIGRMPFSAYLISDYRMVGYSMPWVRPPVEVYQFNPITSFDGADIGYRHNVGDVALFWQLGGGSSKVKTAGANSTAQFKGYGGALSLTVTSGSSTFRAYHTSLKSSYDNSGIDNSSDPFSPFNLLRAELVDVGYGPMPNPYYDPAMADKYQIKNKTITYTSLGYTYDPGGWFVTGELARNAGDEIMLPQATAGYLTAGVRFGAWTPYLTVAQRKNDTHISNPPPAIAFGLDGNTPRPYDVIANVLANTNQAQSSTAIGLRWDFHANMDLKLQCDWVKNATGSYGALVNTQPAFRLGESYNLVTLAFDFVF
jgi:hypothetical protein